MRQLVSGIDFSPNGGRVTVIFGSLEVTITGASIANLSEDDFLF